MTLKLYIFQKFGVTTEKLQRRLRFCCWHNLKTYIDGFSKIFICEQCRKGGHKK